MTDNVIHFPYSSTTDEDDYIVEVSEEILSDETVSTCIILTVDDEGTAGAHLATRTNEHMVDIIELVNKLVDDIEALTYGETVEPANEQ